MVGRTYALTKPWWTWPHHAIRDALEDARVQLCLPVVREVLSENAKAGRHPASFRELHESIARNPRNLERVWEGRYALTNQLALGVAISLGLPLNTFFPEPREWIARTVLVLCKGELVEAEARAYVAYRFSESASNNPHLDPQAVRRTYDGLRSHFSDAGAAERALSRAAHVLGAVLERLTGDPK